MFLRAFHGQLRVHHVGGALIPPFRAPLVTKLYKIIRLSIENLLIFIRIQLDKHARNMWPFLAICHHGTDIDFMCFIVSLQNRP